MSHGRNAHICDENFVKKMPPLQGHILFVVTKDCIFFMFTQRWLSVSQALILLLIDSHMVISLKISQSYISHLGTCCSSVILLFKKSYTQFLRLPTSQALYPIPR